MYKELIFEAKVVKLALNSPQIAAMVIFVAHLLGQDFIFGNFHDQYQKSTCLKYTYKRKKFFDFFLTLRPPSYRLKGICIFEILT